MSIESLGSASCSLAFFDSSALATAHGFWGRPVPRVRGSQAAGKSCRFCTRLSEHVYLYAALVEQAMIVSKLMLYIDKKYLKQRVIARLALRRLSMTIASVLARARYFFLPEKTSGCMRIWPLPYCFYRPPTHRMRING